MPKWPILAVGLAALGWIATRGRPPPFDVEANLDGGKLVELREGRVYHREHGAGADLVLLPGFGGNCQTWTFVTPPLAADHRVHWLDLLGHGLSDKPTGVGYGADAQAGRVAEWMDQVGIGQAVLMASSAGAQPAVALAAAMPERVRGLVLVDPFLAAGAPIRLGLWLSRLWPQATGAVVRMLWRQRWFIRVSNMAGRRHPFTVDDATVDRQYAPYGSDGSIEALPALLDGVDIAAARAAISGVRCPVLLVWGTADRVASERDARTLASKFAAAEVAVLPDSGHVPQEETPDELVAVVRPFLAEVSRASTAD